MRKTKGVYPRKVFITSVLLSGLLLSCASFDISRFANLSAGLPVEKVGECQMPEGELARDSRFIMAFSKKNMSAGSTLKQIFNTKAINSLNHLYSGITNRVNPFEAPSPVPTGLNLNAGAIEEFGKLYAKTVLDPNTYMNMFEDGDAAGQDMRVLANVFKVYYQQYISGNFVDRFGSKFSKPAIKTSIGNESISAALLVFLEAVADTQLNTPVFYHGSGDDIIYYPSGTKTEPTAAKKIIGGKTVVPVIEVIDDSTICGVTEKEAKAISYMSNLAGDKSALLSKLVLESFGGFEVSFVIGGHLSAGNNKTLATIVCTFLESISRRGTERIAYEFFWKFAYGASPATKGETIALSKKLKKIERFVNSFR